MNTFANLQNRAAQVAKHFEISLEEAWQKIHSWIDREIGLVAPTVQKIDGELTVVAQEVSVAVKSDVVAAEKAIDPTPVAETEAAPAPTPVAETEAAPAPAPVAETEAAPVTTEEAGPVATGD